ncbi:MAG TPA: DUF3604 domain-containing protein [Porticoccus sp.]|nr:DUF3604 domain-containing protein [Porticoccus sp.]
MINKMAVSGFLLALASLSVQANEPTNLYWGDTHLHTSYSFDAFLSGNQSADPDTAYRWAKGQPVIHPYTRAKVRIETPLDFLVVSDHAEAMGVMRAIVNNTEELGELSLWESIARWGSLLYIRYTAGEGSNAVFQGLLPSRAELPGTDPVQDPANIMPDNPLGDLTKTEITAWGEIVDAADRHNDPGKFTAFLGWEWSSIPTGANLHRVVISPNGADKGHQYIPFGSDQSQYPEDLWAFLDKTAKQTGSEFIAIPHNSNVSKGYMFPEVTLRGQPITVDYARTRMVWEPVVEMTQIKGDSETHSQLSPNDPFADFENYPFYMQKTPEQYTVSEGDYIRSGLRRGLEIENNIGVNPYKFGLIGSTDSHTGLSSAEEDNFWGKFAHDSTPETKRGTVIIGGTKASGWNMSASGLAAVWATENTRQGIYSSFKRREVYATSGPRISVRVFGGWAFDEAAAEAENIADIGYAQGVPMGGDLIQPTNETAKVQLLIRAVKDPNDANLDRVQVVKGWLDASGKSHEQVFNVAWSAGRELDSNGQLAAVGNSVDIKTASYDNSIGAAELATVWTDTRFDASQRAFYYVRVLQIPTPRHSLYDAVALQIPAPEEGPATIQERAYTSPIWYTPN